MPEPKLMVTVDAEKLESAVDFLRDLRREWNWVSPEEGVKVVLHRLELTTIYLSGVLRKAEREESARCIADAQYDNGVDGA